MLFAVAGVAGCAGPADQRVDVFAAASLTEAFEDIGVAFERESTADVRFNFGASSDLARSILDGSPAQVFAAADMDSMHLVADGGSAESPESFASNEMAIAVARGNPLAIDELGDLSEVSVALCAPEVPCGRYARRVLESAGVALEPRSFEPDVKAVLSRVALGEVDAGVVYGTDVLAAADQVSSVEIPDEHNLRVVYPIALIGHESTPGAQDFYAFVLSDVGQAILRSHGFGSS